MQGDRELDYKEANKAVEINGKRGKPTIKAHKDNYGDVVWHHAAYDEETKFMYNAISLYLRTQSKITS